GMGRDLNRRRGSSLPLRARVYAWAVVAGALVGFAVAASARPAVSGKELTLFAILVVMTAAAWHFPIEFASHVKVYVTGVATFAAVLLLPVSLAMAVAALGAGIGEALNRSRLLQQAFNTAVAALTALASGLIIA